MPITSDVTVYAKWNYAWKIEFETNGGEPLELTQREFELICFLAQSPGKVVSRQELMTEVWQYDYFGDLRTVDVAVRRLREKLETNPAEPEYVMTKRGAGYYMAE